MRKWADISRFTFYVSMFLIISLIGCSGSSVTIEGPVTDSFQKPIPGATVQVTVTVIDHQQVPVHGATVRVLKSVSGGEESVTAGDTDEKGEFTVNGLHTDEKYIFKASIGIDEVREGATEPLQFSVDSTFPLSLPKDGTISLSINEIPITPISDGRIHHLH